MHRYSDQYKILKIYLSNLSVESPHTGRLPSQINQPGIEIDIQAAIARIGLSTYEVAVRVGVAARSGTLPLFLIQLRQAGIFTLKLMSDAERDRLLRQDLPQLIFPAARSAVAASILMAGYQPIVLDHIAIENFFCSVEIEDKRPPQEAAAVPVKVEKGVALSADAAPSRRSGGIRVGRVVWGWAAAILLVTLAPVVLMKSGDRWWMQSASVPEKQLRQGAATAIHKVALHDAGKVAAAQPPKVVAPLRIDGREVGQLAKIGSDWVAAQDGGRFTIEWLRSGDIRRIADFSPVDDGQPLFLVGVAGAQPREYAVVSGAYLDEQHAVKAADKSGLPYHVLKFHDFN